MDTFVVIVICCSVSQNSDKVRHLDDILVKDPLRILRLKTACANHVTVYEKVRGIDLLIIISSHQTLAVSVFCY